MRQREDAHFVDLKQSSEATNGKLKVGYVVSAWPRLSETFILNEVIGVERLGVRLQIFTLKETKDKVPNAKASRVHAQVTCLSIKHNLTAAGRSSVRLFVRQPVRFCQTDGHWIVQP